jgi:hypothetical protein
VETNSGLLQSRNIDYIIRELLDKAKVNQAGTILDNRSMASGSGGQQWLVLKPGVGVRDDACC